MKDTTRYALIRKEVETYRKIADVLDSLKLVVYRFDGRCFDRKFSEALDRCLKNRKKTVNSMSMRR
ncbi:MAG: hypothetical protein HDR28_06305 [Lachnospiraceae bacterium]|nr:hypothetical protein [Lachnospiraceae bacterium]